MQSSRVCPCHSFALQSPLATDQHPDSKQNNSHLFPHCLWWPVQLLRTSLSCFIPTLLSLRSSVLRQWAGGPWGRDPLSFNTSDLSPRTPFLSLSHMPLHSFLLCHSWKPTASLLHADSYYFFLFITNLSLVMRVFVVCECDECVHLYAFASSLTRWVP